MVVLADELLEGFFGHDLAASFQLEKTDDEDYHQAHQKSEGLLGGLVNLVVTNEYVPTFFVMKRTREIRVTFCADHADLGTKTV